MSYKMNLKLKDGVEPSVLVKYGFAPKYDEETGQIKKYVKEFLISVEKNNRQERHHFTFEMYTDDSRFFRRIFHYKAWMSVFQWEHFCHKETMQLLYDLIIDGIVEPVKKE